MKHSTAVWIYIANLALLATHEVDSAFWHEWRLFGLPGGVQLFLMLNFGLFLIVLVGLRQLILRRVGARLASYFLAACGLFAFSIHMWFIATGHREFRLPVSVAILAAALTLSLAQVVVTAKLE